MDQHLINKIVIQEHQRMFRVVLWSDDFTGSKMETIRRKTMVLCQFLYGADYTYGSWDKKKLLISRTKEKVIDELLYNYITREHYLKYDHQYSLSTWLVEYIYKNINNLLRRYRPRAVDERIDDRTDIFDEQNINFRVPYEDYLASASIYVSLDEPEAILTAKELLNMMLGHFGEVDTQVILGMLDRFEAAEAQGISYDLYSKRLSRRRDLFIEQISNLGYFY
jgi:hypothetical protein